MKKVQITLFVFLFSILLTQCSSEKKVINKKLTEMALNLNESTPVMLDSYTRFDKASVTDENVFQYYYTVLNSQNPDSLIEVVSNNLKENIKKEFNRNVQLLIFKENNVSIEYVYNDENNKTIRVIRIDPSDYK